MKIITMYELLGMVKDGKAPKKIKYDNGIYVFNDNKVLADEVYSIEGDGHILLNFKHIKSLNNEVEIIEEKKIPEKFKVHSFGDKDENGNFVSSPFPTDEEFMNKINDIIDYLQYIKK